MIRFRVSPETVTVNGSRVKLTDASWKGLDLEAAEPRAQSSLMLSVLGPHDAPPDFHLRVPFWHPEDGPAPKEPEMFYRVRPRMESGKRWKGKTVKSVTFEKWNTDWWIAVEFDERRLRIAGKGDKAAA